MASSAIDRDFLDWLRTASEDYWHDRVPRDHLRAGVGGLDWQTGTHWRGGMTGAEIADAERRFGLLFPPDYKLFLATLHTPDPPMVGAEFIGSALVSTTGRRFADWTGDSDAIQAAMAWPIDGLLRSVEADHSWHPSWGKRPKDRQHREAVVRELAAGGPPLIPIFGHRYLAGPGDRSGNVILSIYGSDVIVIAPDLRAYLPMEIGLGPRHVGKQPDPQIPFWQAVIGGLS